MAKIQTKDPIVLAKLEEQGEIDNTIQELPNWSEQTMMETIMKVQKDNEELLKRLDALESNNKAEAVKKSKERYKWPIKVCYWLWGGVPVLSYETTKKDKEYDLLYKGNEGRFIDNHYLILELANGEKTGKVLRASFDANKTLSKPQICKVLTTDGDIVSMVTPQKLPTLDISKWLFNTTEYGEIEVSYNCVN